MFLSDEEDLDEVILFDIRERRRFFATAVEPGYGDRVHPRVANGTLVDLDYSTGVPAIFERILRPRPPSPTPR